MVTISVFKLIDCVELILLEVYILTFAGTAFTTVNAANNGPFSGHNVALYIPATQSPGKYCEEDICYGANLAVDSYTDGNFNNGHCSHTEGSRTFATWSVRFDRNYVISGIKIFNRNDLNKRRLSNFVLYGISQNERQTRLHDGGYISEYSQSEIDIQLHDRNFYYGIMIKVQSSHGEYAYLTLCEVQVFAGNYVRKENAPSASLTSEATEAYCPAIPIPPFSNLKADIYQNTGRTFETHGSYQNTAGTIIEFGCFWGSLHGQMRVTCLTDGRYNYNIPSCPTKVPPCSVLNLGVYATPGRNYPEVGSSVSYYCSIGYTRIGPQIITCQINAQWSSEQPICKPVQCNAPVAVTNGTYMISNKAICGTDILNNLHFQCKIRLICDPGFRVRNEVDNECMASGSWNIIDNACDIVNCHYPGRILNGQYVDENQFVVNSDRTFLYGTVIHVKCDMGYTEAREVLRLCQADGTWSGQNPQCNIDVCSLQNLIPVPNGHFVTETENAVETEIVNFNQSVQVKCNIGYQLQSNYSLTTCLSGGKWSNQDASCSIITCPKPTASDGFTLVIHNNASDGMFNVDTLPFCTIIHVLCEDGILVQGSKIKKCNETGFWSGDDPVCASLCKATNISHGYLIDINNTLRQSYKEDDNISLVCNAGYEPKDGLETFTCKRDHSWNYKPQCIIKLCPPPEHVNNGLYLTMESTYQFNTSVLLLCENGYYNAAGNETRLCQENRTWSGRNPECLKMDNLQNRMSNLAGPIGGSIGGILLFGIVAIVLVIIYKKRKPLSGLIDKNIAKTSFGLRKSRAEVYATIVVKNTDIQETAIDEQSPREGKRKEVYFQSSNGVYSNTDTSNNPYYSFSETERIPDSALLVAYLSDLVLSGDVVLKRLRDEFEEIPDGLTEKYSEAIKLHNRRKNRYRNLYAYDETRVVLQTDLPDESDYINACYIHGFQELRAYVAAQGPTKETIVDFWRMIWQTGSSKIVMLTKLIEEDKAKCEQYWPESDNLRYGNMEIVLVATDLYSDFIIRTLKLKKTACKAKLVTHFQYTAWPDKGVPKYASSLVQFRNKVTHVTSHEKGPVVVHCSAGVGRTGTFIALDYLTKQGQKNGYVDVLGTVKALRKQRVNLVQTLDQYVFIHHALVETLMLSTSALPSSIFPRAYQGLLEIDRKTGKRKLDQEFEMLKKLSPVTEEEQYVSAKFVRNRNKNRYLNILPVEEFIPRLSPEHSTRANEYINAVFLPNYKMKKAFIITLTPLEKTINDFWKLVWEHNIHTIVMMNNREEMQSGEVYWPCDKDNITFGGFHIFNDGVLEIDGHMVVSMTVTSNSEVKLLREDVSSKFSVVVCAPGRSLPDSPRVILTLLDLVQAWQQQSGNQKIVVHCMNGAEKSGLFCVVSAVIERMKIEQDVAISHVVEDMRYTREQIISHAEQYQFIHEVVLAYIQQNEMYSNFTL